MLELGQDTAVARGALVTRENGGVGRGMGLCGVTRGWREKRGVVAVVALYGGRGKFGG